MVEELSHASRGLVNGKDVGSSKLPPKVVGASPGPFPLARGNATPPNQASRSVRTPNPEVKVRRRRLTREYKIRILKEADKLKGKPGAIGELVRREGLYSSTLAQWRRQRNDGSLGQIRGRKPRPPEALEIEKLKKENAKLREEKRQYRLVIEAQKKISEILGIRQDNVPPMPEEDEDE